jgi:hypothetical protein
VLVVVVAEITIKQVEQLPHQTWVFLLALAQQTAPVVVAVVVQVHRRLVVTAQVQLAVLLVQAYRLTLFQVQQKQQPLAVEAVVQEVQAVAVQAQTAALQAHQQQTLQEQQVRPIVVVAVVVATETSQVAVLQVHQVCAT